MQAALSRWKTTAVLAFLVFALSSYASAASPTSRHEPEATVHNVFVIENVNVIPLTAGGELLPNASVVIGDKKITSINGVIPRNAKKIDGTGKWLIPGLIDMHAHVPTDGHFNNTFPTRVAAIFTSTQDVMTPFVTNGVTTVFEPIAKAGHFGQRNEILRGDVIGPRMALAAFINGGDDDGRTANTPSDGRQTVRLAKADGYEFIKVYSQLNIETFKAIIDEANKQGIRVIGHIPNAFKGRIEEAFVPNSGLVAHAEEFAKQTETFSEQDARHFARLAKENGTWLSPTLTVMVSMASQARSLEELRMLPSLQYVHPLLQSKWLTANRHNKGTTPDRVARLEKMVEFNKRLVKTFKEAGVPIVAGTDAGSSGVVWGFSLHDEMRLLVEAGLTAEEALTSATRLAATWLGMDKVIGTVEAGKSADLVLLDANPLTNIESTRKISGVFINGRWLDKAEISAMLRDLSNRNAATKDEYDWSMREDY